MKKKISIRIVLILGMPGIFIGIISFILLSSYFSSKPVFTEHAREIMENISSYTIDKSRSHLNPARDAALLTSGLAVNHIVTSSRKTEMEHYFFEQLVVNPQISNIYYGTVEGEFIMISRKDYGFMSKDISFTDDGREVLFRETDHSFEEKISYFDNSDTYDPRKRPWFIKAIENKSLIWTDPYVFFESRNPGITTASPVFNENGSLHGVVGVDIEISELSEFLASLSIGKNGKAFILDNTGHVLAYPDQSLITHLEGESDSITLVNISDLEDQISLAAYNALQSHEYQLDEERDFFFTFRHSGQMYHAMFSPFKASYWPWLLGIYIPEDDYIGALKRNRSYTVVVSGFLGLVSMLVGFFITRTIVFPLKKIQAAAKAVGAGRLNVPLDLESFYSELDETAKIFEVMRIGLEEKARIEEQLQHTRKVESIGRLAGGVAHDLNNLLTPILGYSEILINKMDEGSQLRQVQQILKAGTKAKDLVQQLLAFSRKQELEYKPLDLNKVVRGFEKLLGRTIREDISIEIVESELEPVVMADPGQIEQVILNLCVNAQDAMPGGGVLTIELTVVHVDKVPQGKERNLEEGQYVLLAVSDTGCGMEQAVIDKIFEPFFSTKGEFGIGLGLATVYGIVNQHNGDIIVYSEPDRGSTFKVYLPYSAAMVEPAHEENQKNENEGGTETVLVAEDNSSVMELTETILENLGYNVLVARNGHEALKILKEYEGTIHMLLTDVIMPEMNGKELYVEARRYDENLKVLFMSGYADRAIAHHNVFDMGAQFIQKPFSMGGLAKKIREVLEND